MSTRNSFPSISPAAWEHPADKAALAAFTSLPGGEALIKRLVGSTTERSLRLEALANGARVTPNQFARVHDLVVEASRILDAPELPEAYVRQSPEAGAFTIGVDKPFFVLTSGSLELWDDEELLAVIGHELGHILSGHAIYKTALRILLGLAGYFAGGNLIGFAAIQAASAALREWDRKSELSADRAGLLVVQDSTLAYRTLMKSAGGHRVGEMDINEFFRQAHDYDQASDGLDSLYKLLGLLGETHPFPVVRMTSLQEWERGGAYDSILSGRYPRREEGSRGDPGKLFNEAKDSYARDFSSSADPLSRAASTVMDAVDGFFKNGPGAGFPGAGFPGQGEARDDRRDQGGKREGPPRTIEEALDDFFRTMR